MKSELLRFFISTKAFLALFVLLLFAGDAIAQTGFTLTGKVTDGETPLANVSIQVKGSTTGTKTNENGSFSIGVVRGQTLVFTSVGYETREVVVGSQRNITVTITHNYPAFTKISG